MPSWPTPCPTLRLPCPLPPRTPRLPPLPCRLRAPSAALLLHPLPVETLVLPPRTPSLLAPPSSPPPPVSPSSPSKRKTDTDEAGQLASIVLAACAALAGAAESRTSVVAQSAPLQC